MLVADHAWLKKYPIPDADPEILLNADVDNQELAQFALFQG